jgi:hypothetical protein
MVYDSGGVKTFFFFLRYTGCSEDEDSFHYFIKGSTTKVDLGVEFLSSDEEN